MKQLRALLFTALLLVSSLALNAQTTKYAAIIKASGRLSSWTKTAALSSRRSSYRTLRSAPYGA